MADRVKYAEVFADWLVDLGYTHCFFVAGGNIMHLLDGVRTRMTCVPTVHEVAAGLAAEAFNATSDEGRAFALVTAGPGLTNITTAMASAYLDRRELLVIGGQVKSSDLATDDLRQRGIQEIDGVALSAPMCVATLRVEQPVDRATIEQVIAAGAGSDAGPVFIEMCLDAQGAPVMPSDFVAGEPVGGEAFGDVDGAVADIVARLVQAERPVILIGGAVDRATAYACLSQLETLGVPVMTTWTGIDRVPSDCIVYAGRPDTWGQRAPNLVVAQADLVVVIGARLGLQETGFNWQEFGRGGDVVQVYPDAAELRKGHPTTAGAHCADASAVLRGVCDRAAWTDALGWPAYVQRVRELLPVIDPENSTNAGFACPYRFAEGLSDRATSDDAIVICSSGGANSVPMQVFQVKHGQSVMVDSGLASMGVGLGHAIGAAFGNPGHRVLHIEGDGGFCQNLQELAIVDVNRLPIKMIIWANDGYGSIRTTQRNYFGGAYLGCDTDTGLGFPHWEKLFDAFHIPVTVLGERGLDDPAADAGLESNGPHAFIVPIDPEQSYWPKITSRVTETGSMESNPLYRMSPDIPEDIAGEVTKYLS